MVLQWAMKRLIKFLLKRLNKYLKEEVDLEQLDVQLGSGCARLTGVVLNSDYINEQVKHLPFVLKHGAFQQVLVKLPCEIQLEGLDILVAPRPRDHVLPGEENAVGEVEGIQQSTDAGEATYLGVNDGVRMIGQMVRGLLLGLRVKVIDVFVRLEDGDHCVTLRVPQLHYGYQEPFQEPPPGSATITKVVNFENASVTIGADHEGAAAGFSGSVGVTIPESDTISTVDLDVSVNPIRFRLTMGELQQAVALACSFRNSERLCQEASVYHDTGSLYESALQGQKSTMKAADTPLNGKSALPVIVDWMRKPKQGELDLAASIDEFFECFDAWNQSGSGSGLWSWTRSALAGASSQAADDSQDVQMEYAAKVRLDSVSACFLFDGHGAGLELRLDRLGLESRVSQLKSTFDFGVESIDLIYLTPSDSQKEYGSLLSNCTLPRFPCDLRAHDSGRISLLRASSSTTCDIHWWNSLWGNGARRPAVRLVADKSPAQTKVSVTLQPVILWLDVPVVRELSRTISQLQVPACGTSADAPEQSAGGGFKLSIAVPCIRTFLSASGYNGPMLALDLVQSAGDCIIFEQQPKNKTGLGLVVTVTNGSLYVFRRSLCAEVLRLQSDNNGKARVDVRWKDNVRTGPWIAKKTWDNVAAQKYFGLGLKSSEFAAATSFEPSSVVDLLKSTSATVVQVLLPKLRLDLSGSEQLAVLELLPHLVGFGTENKAEDRQGSQAVISLTCRQVEAVLNLSCTRTSNDKSNKTHDSLQVKLSSFKFISGLGLGGAPDAFYLNIQHSDAELLGFDVVSSPAFVKTSLVSCKADVIGRGDGGGQNALATGTAGLSFTFISWPGKRQQLGDALLTGTLKGCTLLAVGGRFDWVPALTTFLERCKQPFEKLGKADQACEARRRPFFLFDAEDIALSYEPEEAPREVQAFSPVACVLAAAALRVSSSELGTTQTQYEIWLKDVALHLVDTGLRRIPLGEYTSQSMRQAGYVRVAKGPSISAAARICNDDASWEVDCARSQLFFDSCSDTTAAFGRLVGDLQQILVPDIQRRAELQLRSLRGKSVESVSSAESSEELQGDLCSTEALFEGVVENAFSELEHKKVYEGGNSLSQYDPSILLAAQTDTLLHRLETTDSPSFIEDYYDAASTSASCSQEFGSPNTLEELDFEPKGGWYAKGPVDVFDYHISTDDASSSRTPRTPSSSYPKVVGRVTCAALDVRWRLYDGSDWDKVNPRKMDVCMEVSISRVDLQYDSFGPTGLHASVLHVEIGDLEMHDCSARAPWKSVLRYYSKMSRPRESTSKALRMRMDAVRPNPSLPLEEYRLSIALLPMWLHLDQDHALFLMKFFAPPSDKDVSSTPGVAENIASSPQDIAMLPFFQVCEIRSFTVRIDYVPRRIDLGALRCGNIIELLNVVSWKGVEVHLKPVHAKAKYGWSDLMGVLLDEWLADISKHQVYKLAKGFGPIRPLCAVGAGAAKLVVFPAEQYKKDRRLLRGMRKGAVAFIQSISLEALGFGANIAAGAHQILLHTELALGGGETSNRRDPRRTSQPSDTREGFHQAYESMSQGFERSAVSLFGNPVKVYQREGSAGLAFASALKGSPTALLAPASAAADAMRQAFLGVRNSLDPERKREFDAKHRGSSSW